MSFTSSPPFLLSTGLWKESPVRDPSVNLSSKKWQWRSTYGVKFRRTVPLTSCCIWHAGSDGDALSGVYYRCSPSVRLRLNYFDIQKHSAAWLWTSLVSLIWIIVLLLWGPDEPPNMDVNTRKRTLIQHFDLPVSARQRDKKEKNLCSPNTLRLRLPFKEQWRQHDLKNQSSFI